MTFISLFIFKLKRGDLPLVLGFFLCASLMLEHHGILPHEMIQLDTQSRFWLFAVGFGLILSGIGLMIKDVNKSTSSSDS
jgi:hypothetical protein